MLGRAFLCRTGHYCVKPGIFVSNHAFCCRTGLFVSDECYNNVQCVRPIRCARMFRLLEDNLLVTAKKSRTNRIHNSICAYMYCNQECDSTFCQWGLLGGTNLNDIIITIQDFDSGKCIWSFRLHNDSHFGEALIRWCTFPGTTFRHIHHNEQLICQ